jgi:hypothetical protein
LLPGAELLLEALGDFGVGGDDVVFFGGVGADVEELAAGVFGGVDDELEAVVEQRAGAGEILGADGGVVEVLEIARGGAVGAEFGEGRRPFWSARSM